MNIAFKQWIEAAISSNRDDCLFWPYGRTGAGYGVLYVDGKQHLVHRHICLAVWGEAPDGKTDVAHACGNGHLGCANPKHLRWATRSENMRDRRVHGTSKRGEENHQAKLNSEQVLEIRSSSEFRKKLAARFGVSPALITLVRQRKVWAHI